MWPGQSQQAAAVGAEAKRLANWPSAATANPLSRLRELPRLLLGGLLLLRGVTLEAILTCQSLCGVPSAVSANDVRLSTRHSIDRNKEHAEDVVNALLT